MQVAVACLWKYTANHLVRVLKSTTHISHDSSSLRRSWKQGKGKAVPLQAWSDPEGSRKLRFPDFMKTAQDGGKVVSLTHRPPLLPVNTPGTHFF